MKTPVRVAAFALASAVARPWQANAFHTLEFQEESRCPRERSAETLSAIPRWRGMSDAFDYFMSHAIEAARKARAMPSSHWKRKQRTVARVYHLLAKESAYRPNVHHIDDFRAARRLQRQIDHGV
jgi:hypothetical protein